MSLDIASYALGSVNGTGNSVDEKWKSCVDGFTPLFSSPALLATIDSPLIIKCPECHQLPPLFNSQSGKLNFDTIEVYLAEGNAETAVYNKLIPSGSNYNRSGVRRIKIRCGDSEVIRFSNTYGKQFSYYFHTSDLSVLDFVIDASLYTGGYCWFGSGLEEIRFKENTIPYIKNFWTYFVDSSLLSQESLLSISNGLFENAGGTLTLHEDTKSLCNETYVTYSEITDETGLHNKASLSEEGSGVTLTYFITQIKGWTIA